MEVARPIVAPIVISSSLKEQTYEALRQAITSMNLYEPSEAPKLDERHLAESLGVSRTPVREALARLEQEGLVQTISRRGVFVGVCCRRLTVLQLLVTVLGRPAHRAIEVSPRILAGLMYFLVHYLEKQAVVELRMRNRLVCERSGRPCRARALDSTRGQR